MSNEFFYYLDGTGQKRDAELHEPILAGDHKAAKAVTRRRLLAQGWTEAEIADWLGEGGPDP